MGLCSKRHFLLTICTLQLVTTVERQVFDFLGFMWVPILINFFNIIFVILGFFGAFQYRPKYIISYCVWNALWFGWNVFLTCFYLSAGALDKNSDILNLGTGSFSWWQINGPGCKPYYNNTVPDRPDVYRPARPDSVTGCVLDYEVIEVLHSSTQCLLAVMAVIGGICLSRAFMEEDDSFDFVGGGDFGMAGHTPLHPMYVSYSALPPPGHQQHQQQLHHHQHQQQHSTMHSKHSAGDDNYFYYASNTGTTTGGSRRSSTTLISPVPTLLADPHARGGSNKKPLHAPSSNNNPSIVSDNSTAHLSERAKAMLRNARNANNAREQTTIATTTAPTTTTIDYADYSNPVDQLRAASPDGRRSRGPDYDTLERHTPDLSWNRRQLQLQQQQHQQSSLSSSPPPPRYYQQRQQPQQHQPPANNYSPLMGARNFNRSSVLVGAGGNNGSNGRQHQHQHPNQNRNSYRPPPGRFRADHIRGEQHYQQQQQQRLGSPRLNGSRSPAPPPSPTPPAPPPRPSPQHRQAARAVGGASGLRSFYSDPRLAMALEEEATTTTTGTQANYYGPSSRIGGPGANNAGDRSRRRMNNDARPLSMFVNNY